jgi:hypothetical protein
MNKKQQARMNSLFVNGNPKIPKYVRVYDNGGIMAGGTIDRYTIVFSGNYRKRLPNGQFDCWIQVLGMSESPCHPQGFCQHSEYEHPIDTKNGWSIPIGRKNHLGKRIPFEALNESCRAIVLDDYRDIWNWNKSS